MIIRVQEQDNNANGYLNSVVSSSDILQLVLKIANKWFHTRRSLIGRRFPYGIGQDISNNITFIHMISIIQEGGSTRDRQL